MDAIFATDEAKERSPKVSSGNGQAKSQAAPPELHIISVASLAGKPVPPREWFVPDVIIANRVTILSGNGGDGKSLLAAQLGVATVTETDWIGYLPKPGGVIYASAEDDPDEIHRRIADIIAGRDELSFEAMRGFDILDLSATDAILPFTANTSSFGSRRRRNGLIAALASRLRRTARMRVRSRKSMS